MVAAAVLRGSLRPGTSVVAVRLRDGRTWTVGSWDMTGSDGHLDVDEMRLSPGGAWLACQLREMHPAGGGSVREVGTRGIVIPLGDGDEAIVDLGPGIRGSMRWAPDGGFLYFLRPRRGEGATLLRVEFPASRAPANPRLQWPDGAPQAGGPRAWPPRPAEAATPSRAFSRDDLVAAIIRLSADDRATRLTAAAELESMPDPMAVGPLVTALEAGDPALCTAASRTLQILLPHPSPPRPASGDKEACATAAAAWRTWLIDHPTSLGAKHEN